MKARTDKIAEEIKANPITSTGQLQRAFDRLMARTARKLTREDIEEAFKVAMERWSQYM